MQVVRVQKRTIIKNFIVVVLCVAMGWYLKAKLTPQAAVSMGMGGIVPHVLVEEAITMDVSPQKQYIATVEPINSVNLVPQVSGYIEKVLFQEGSLVNKGDILFIIEQDKYLANIELAEAALDSAKANFVRAQADYNRQKALSTKQYASKSTLESSESAYLQAKAAVSQAKANLELAQIDLKHTEIKAPISGHIGKALATEGNFVNNNSLVLARIVQDTPIRVVFSISDKEQLLYKNFAGEEFRTRLVLPDGTILNENPTSVFVDNEINRNTATLAIYFEYNNNQNKLTAGNYVNVIVSSANETQQVVISPAAIMRDSNGAFVYVVDEEGTVSERRVQLDGTFEGKQIVLEGLNGNEKIVVSGLQKVSDGAKVRASIVSNQNEEAK